jgi:hypothetical protein
VEEFSTIWVERKPSGAEDEEPRPRGFPSFRGWLFFPITAPENGKPAISSYLF